MSERHIILSGCSGGGKSTLVAELARRGVRTVAEPGRRIVEEELRGDGAALPWVDRAAFARRALDMARRDRRDLRAHTGAAVFDRGLIDAAVALRHSTGEPLRALLGDEPPFHRTVFLTPPWPEIFAADAERRHDLAEAIAEYDRLLAAYRELGYETVILPKTSVADRADIMLARLGPLGAPGETVAKASSRT